MDWKQVKADLSKPLDRKHVKPPPQGKYGEYIEGWHAIAEANAIFGFDGWSYNVQALSLTNEEVDGGKNRVGYMATICVTVDGVHRCDVGHGQGFGKSLGDAHDSAVKEAVTDGLKRALRSFGWRFGLALYDKSQENVEDVSAVEAMTAEHLRQIEGADDLERLQQVWAEVFRAWKRMGKEPPAPLVGAKDKRKDTLGNEKEAA